jgi:hypothetical protein
MMQLKSNLLIVVIAVVLCSYFFARPLVIGAFDSLAATEHRLIGN